MTVDTDVVARIDATLLPQLDRHHLRLLVHCLDSFKTMASGGDGHLPDAASRRRWCEQQPVVVEDPSFLRSLLLQLDGAGRQLDELAQQLGIQVDWQIVQVPALREPKDPGAQADRAALHKYIRGRYVADDLQRYAPHPLHDLFDSHRSEAAAIGLLWVRQHQADIDAYVQAVFARYWQRQQGIDDLGDIEAVLKELNLSVVGFKDFAAVDGVDRAAANLEVLRAKGVTTSPTYLLGDEPFQGRQHLPLLRARLQAAQQN